MMRTITGLFDSRSEAEAVIAHLRSHDGVDASRITIHGQMDSTGSAADTEDRGFWASLRDLFIPDEDRYVYSEGIRRGGYVVSAEVPDTIVEHALDVFEEHGAVDLDTREAEWRSAGWSGYEAGAMGSDNSAGTGLPMNSSAAVGAATMGGTSTPAVGGTTGMAAAGTGMAGTAPGATTGATTGAAMGGMNAARGTETKEERIPIVEEQLRVGKREMDRGRVRVRSYVVETPVSESVTLRDEHVHVERRAVDLPLSAADDAFRDRTIEAVEHSEEAVVSKEARVKEELVIRKDMGQRTQNVTDTVRHTEVEVEDDRTAGATGTPKRPAGV
ncbi:conserved domain-containing protein [Roseomonas rosea]|uniref:Conserved domain-containing protein n=1 Tax=Muricoccus roseus TaxID=198092 RepID=A0A1M6E2W1_9PROT|nr:YsnF/AvaK domain-containing protein [Roseomonas rosea]SHI79781.1 conserved domain-containing protein [Roseomonas rosea]